jgi:hypothetical protein
MYRSRYRLPVAFAFGILAASLAAARRPDLPHRMGYVPRAIIAADEAGAAGAIGVAPDIVVPP